MNQKHRIFKGRFILLLMIFMLFVSFVVSAASKDLIYQISTYDSLSKGGYAGIVPLKDLTKNGDFGIGTFEGINGEMVMMDKVIYQVTVDGKVHPKKGSDLTKELTPYAVVTFFDNDIQESLAGVENYAALQSLITGKLPNPNHFYAIRLDGTFEYIKTRSVPVQTQPYPALTEVIKQQATFDMNNVQGTLVGFWCPGWVGGVNVAGFHLHFLTNDKLAGGHCLELKLKEGTLKIDNTAEFYINIGK